MMKLEATKNHDVKQHYSLLQKEEQKKLLSKNKNDLREFMEQRAEQRRLFQANKSKVQLAEFMEQRARARREYRTLKAQGEKLAWAHGDSQRGAVHLSSHSSPSKFAFENER